jgi:multimeric flavodoxin WrbA
MNILVLNGGPLNVRGTTCRKIKETVADRAQGMGWNVTAYDLEGLNLKPCRGCFACWVKHPGTCIVKDDEELILKAMAESDAQTWITPVTFGGYSVALKRALDRAIPNLLPFFTIRQGEIHHPTRYEKRRSLLVLGTLPSPHAEAERIFHGLVRRNALNLDSIMTDSRVFYDGVDEKLILPEVTRLLDAAKEAR